MPEDKLESLFAPYFRLDKSRNKNSGGIGLGLNIARNIARAHGGKLYLENTTSKGLLAVLTLPVE
ncbi:ATP-binding protein [Motiliproteus sp. MSK22-1]|uniref:ATP-binding protein n=1 Tax=Motiliproteus sp. MSK22-1 TaxID=1897630 RepID=UPI0009F8623D